MKFVCGSTALNEANPLATSKIVCAKGARFRFSVTSTVPAVSTRLMVMELLVLATFATATPSVRG